MKVSNSTLVDLARSIRPQLMPRIYAGDTLSRADVIAALKALGSNVRSERSLGLIEDALVEDL